MLAVIYFVHEQQLLASSILLLASESDVKPVHAESKERVYQSQSPGSVLPRV